MKILNINITNKLIYKLGIAYTFVIIIISAVINYFTWHAQFPSVLIENVVYIITGLLWILFYLPMYVFISKDNWGFKDFGFVINRKLIIVVTIILVFIFTKFRVSLNLTIICWTLVEAIARVGEEVFFRGYIFTMSIKLFQGKNASWIMAIIISSLMFTVIHTQTFLPENPLNLPSIFLTSIVLGFSRYWTKSILPGIIIHCVSNGGLECMIFGIIIYLLVLTGAKVGNLDIDQTS